jgi:hypothetical protein
MTNRCAGKTLSLLEIRVAASVEADSEPTVVRALRTADQGVGGRDRFALNPDCVILFECPGRRVRSATAVLARQRFTAAPKRHTNIHTTRCDTISVTPLGFQAGHF